MYNMPRIPTIVLLHWCIIMFPRIQVKCSSSHWLSHFLLFAPVHKVTVHHAVNLWSRGDDLLSTVWVITTSQNSMMNQKRKHREISSWSQWQNEKGRARGNKKEETECTELDSKLYKPREKHERKDIEIEQKEIQSQIKQTERSPR